MSALINKKTKMSDLINYRIKVTTLDGRQFVGKLLSFDKHMNLVISECEEFRITKKSQQLLVKQAKQLKKVIDESKIVEDKRFLGLIILRGEHVISLSVEGGLSGKPILKKNEAGLNKITPKGTAKVLGSSTGNNRMLSSNGAGSSAGTGGPIRNTGARRFNPPPGFKR